MIRRLGQILALLAAPLMAGDTRFCLKVVDDTEAPVAEVQFFYRWEGYPDWRPVNHVLCLGPEKEGGGFQTIEETDSNLRNSNAREEFLRLQINYYFCTSTQAAFGWLKVVAPGLEPVEMQVPFPSDYKWERVQLPGRSENRRNRERDREPQVQDRMPDAVVVLQVLAENDQRTPRDDIPLAGAQVTVTMEASGRTYQVVSGGGGNVHLGVPEPGRATIEVSAPGYRPKHWRTRLESGRREEQRITLLTARAKS